MDDKPYTPETMEQIGKIYDKLDQFPADSRFIVKLMIEAFINGMSAQERLAASQDGT